MISVESVTPVIERSLTLVEETGFRRMCQRLDPPFRACSLFLETSFALTGSHA